MMKWCLYISGCAISLSELYSLEIETLLHSSADLFIGGDVVGVLVSKGEDVPDVDYGALLLAEKYLQDFFYLAEFDVVAVEIASSGTPFALHRLKTPTNRMVDASVRRLDRGVKIARDVLPRESGIEADFQSLQKAMELLRGVEKTNAVRRVGEVAFLLHRYRELESRFFGPHDIDAARDGSVRAYANQARTRPQELDFIFRRLLGRRRMDGEMFEDILLRDMVEFLRPANILASALDTEVPYKLTIAHDESVMDAFCRWTKWENDHKWFKMRAHASLRRHYDQAERYVHANDRLVASTYKEASSEASLIATIREAQMYRRMALVEYSHFRIPFIKSGKRMFDFYMADPEERSGRNSEFRGSEPMPFTKEGRAATGRFIDAYLRPIFDEISPPLFSGLLTDVVIRKRAHPAPAADDAVTVLHKGRTMLILLDENPMFFSLRNAVRHACGDVFSQKSGAQLALELANIRQTRPHFTLSTQVESLIRDTASLTNTVWDGERITRSGYAREQQEIASSADTLLSIWDDTYIGEMEPAIMERADKLEINEVEELETVRDVYAERARNTIENLERYPSTLILDSEKLPGFASYRASISARDEAADLSHRLDNRAQRLALLTFRQDDPVLMEKVALLFRLYRTVENLRGETVYDAFQRAMWIRKLREVAVDESMKKFYSNSLELFPPAVVAVSDSEGATGENPLKTTIEAEDFVVESIRQGHHKLSLIHLHKRRGASEYELLYAIGDEAESGRIHGGREVEFFGAKQDSKSQLVRALGKRAKQAEVPAEIAELVARLPSCVRISLVFGG